MEPNPHLPDPDFVAGVRDWASKVPLLAAQALVVALEKEEWEDNKKALRLKIFAEYCLATEQLLSMVYVVRHLKGIDGFCERLVDVPLKAEKFTEIYQRIVSCEHWEELFAYLGIGFNHERHEPEPEVFEGFLRQLKASFSNRWEGEDRLRNTKTFRYFNKIKYGVPIVPSPEDEYCWWFWRESKGGGLECTDLRISEEFAAEMVGGIEAVSRSIYNLCDFVLTYGLVDSADAVESGLG